MYPILSGELYGPLQDLSLFNQVKIDPDVHTLVWPNGMDFPPRSTIGRSTNRPSRRWRNGGNGQRLETGLQIIRMDLDIPTLLVQSARE